MRQLSELATYFLFYSRLGLIFGIILAVVAILGSLREECYLVLTNSIALACVFVATLFKPLAAFEELLIFCYVALSFYFSFLLYRRTGTTPLL